MYKSSYFIAENKLLMILMNLLKLNKPIQSCQEGDAIVSIITKEGICCGEKKSEK